MNFRLLLLFFFSLSFLLCVDCVRTRARTFVPLYSHFVVCKHSSLTGNGLCACESQCVSNGHALWLLQQPMGASLSPNPYEIINIFSSIFKKYCKEMAINYCGGTSSRQLLIHCAVCVCLAHFIYFLFNFNWTRERHSTATTTTTTTAAV